MILVPQLRNQNLFFCVMFGRMKSFYYLCKTNQNFKISSMKTNNSKSRLTQNGGGKFQNSFFCSLKSAAAVAILAVALPMMMSCGSDSDALPDLTDSVDSIHVTAPAPNPSSPADTLGVNNEMGSGGQL